MMKDDKVTDYYGHGHGQGMSSSHAEVDLTRVRRCLRAVHAFISWGTCKTAKIRHFVRNCIQYTDSFVCLHLYTYIHQSPCHYAIPSVARSDAGAAGLNSCAPSSPQPVLRCPPCKNRNCLSAKATEVTPRHHDNSSHLFRQPQGQP